MAKKKQLLQFSGLTLLVIGMAISFSNIDLLTTKKSEKPPKVRSSNSPKSSPNAAAERENYFFNMLRDPATNQIPSGIRSRELAFYETLPKSSLKGTTADYTWSEAGPNDVGGRTRALAIDVLNSDIVIAGGVSGGIWKSTDKGESWTLTNSPDETYSVTSLCQDTRSGHEDNWYYASGEFNSNSASETGAYYAGYGIYKSTDNGDSWSLIFGGDDDFFSWDYYTDYVSKIMVDPSSGEIYFASHPHGIFSISENESGSYTLNGELGGMYDHIYSDFDFDAYGNILVVLSQYSYNETTTNNPGVYYKVNGDNDFIQIDSSSTTFPSEHQRSVIHFAPSDTTIGYVFTNIDGEDVAFHKIDITNNSLIDRSDFLPSFNSTTGYLGPQANYNMTLAIHPTDPNFIVIGNTSLFRSTDAFETKLDENYSWIGGYDTDGSYNEYPNHHPDCHISVFDPNDNNALWSGHDGGLSYVDDITQTTSSSYQMPWVDKNNGYNVTQFYAIADINQANDDRYIGGTQDNGTPVFTHSSTTGSSKDISSGDGGYCYLGTNYAYVSAQYGPILRTAYNDEDIPLNPYDDDENTDWAVVTPSEATGQLFINPFVVNPNDEQVMYYAAGEQVWINKAIEDIPTFQSEATTLGWSAPSTLDVSNFTVTTLAISTTPANVLYYGAYSSSSQPLIYKVENSTADDADIVRTNISISESTSGSYPYYIAINPEDADEIIVVFTNYNVPSLFHSTDGGTSFTQIDGNLSFSALDTDPTISDVSVRCASILNWDDTKTYYISTSIGVYKTETLNGESTEWENVAPDQLGNVVCNMVKTCDLDGKVVVATHGRGIFVGTAPESATSIEELTDENAITLTVFPNPSNGSFNINIADISTTEYHVSIYNTNSKIVYNKVFNTSSDLNNYQFNLSELSTGLYIIKIEADNQVYTEKINML